MAAEFYTPGQTAGLTLYGVTRQGSTIYRTDTHVFEVPVSAHWASYAISMAPQYSGATAYQGDFPTAVTAPGTYALEAYAQAGGSPASTDSLAATGSIYWDGTKATYPPSSANVVIAGITGVNVNAYANGPGISVSNAAPVVNIFVERGSDDIIPLTYTVAGVPTSLLGYLLVLHAKITPSDTDAAAVAHWASAAVTLGGIVYTNCITLLDQTVSGNAGQFYISPPKVETASTATWPDFRQRPYSIKAFGATQLFVVRGVIQVASETVLTLVPPA